MNDGIRTKLKDEFQNSDKLQDSIPNFINDKYLGGDNEKYMKMYNWMSRGYDIVETVVGKLKYGNEVDKMRKATMDKLEWKDNISVLYVSIGTGKDLKFIPNKIDKPSLNICGADISLGMLKKCQKNYHNKMDVSLINCCAEDLPFKDNSFDIVFHVGGINFFNDKQSAINEMLRVAKNGTKLLIADETNDLINQQYKKSSLSKKYFKDVKMDLAEIESLIPSKCFDKKTDMLWDGKFYCITFRK